MDWLLSLHVALACSGMVSILCRLAKMSEATQPRVILQHGLLFAGLLWSMLVPAQYAALPVLAGVAAFLILSADRWRRGPPDGTARPMPLADESLRHVSGGRGGGP